MSWYILSIRLTPISGGARHATNEGPIDENAEFVAIEQSEKYFILIYITDVHKRPCSCPQQSNYSDFVL
jgi:hypothetical protein